MATMKALRMTREGNAPPSLTIESIPKPEPGPGQLLIKIVASTVQPADILNSHGGFSTTTFPRTTGKDFAGTVESGASHWLGRDVFGTSGSTFGFTVDGGQAEYAIVPEGAAVKPYDLSFAQAAAIGTPWSTAQLAVERGGVEKGDVVMVLGATGSVGSAIMQIAKAKGCKTIGVGRHGTDVNSMTDPELKSAVEMTGGKGPDVVVDTVGDFSLTKAAFNILAFDGRLVTIIAPRQGSTELGVDILSLYRRQISVVGCNSAAQSQEVLGKSLRDLAEWFKYGQLMPPAEKDLNLIKLDQALEAYAGKIKKAVIVFD